MTRQRLTTALLIYRSLCVAAVLTLPVGACGGDAQDGSAQTAAGRGKRFDPKTYALDEAAVRKLAAITRAWDPRGPEPATTDPNAYVDPMARMRKGVDFENKIVAELTEQNSTATIESVPELNAAIAREGLTPRQFAELYLAYKTAEGQLMVAGLSQLAGAVSGTAAPNTPQPESTSATVFESNLALLRRMDKEGTLPPSWW